MGEKIVRYECTKQKCKWQGTDKEKVTLRNQKSGWNEHCCPKCGNNEFYGLLEQPLHITVCVYEKWHLQDVEI